MRASVAQVRWQQGNASGGGRQFWPEYFANATPVGV
jgi:hypothetical protein